MSLLSESADVILRFPFRSYQLVNLGSQLIAFFYDSWLARIDSLRIENFIINENIYMGLYFLNVRMKQ